MRMKMYCKQRKAGQATWDGVMQELEEIDNLAKCTLTHR